MCFWSVAFIHTQCGWKCVWLSYYLCMSLVQNIQTIHHSFCSACLCLCNFKFSFAKTIKCVRSFALPYMFWCSCLWKLINHFKPVGSRIKDSILIKQLSSVHGWMAPCIYKSLHLNFVVHHVVLFLFNSLRSFDTSHVLSKNIFWGMWISVCYTQLLWTLSICICFSFYWNYLTNWPFHPCITQPHFALRAPKLLRYLADWFWLAFISLGSLTRWRGAAVYAIAGKLVNQKCPGIWCCFNMAFACLCSYAFCSAPTTDSQTLHKWENVGFLQISHLPI